MGSTTNTAVNTNNNGYLRSGYNGVKAVLGNRYVQVAAASVAVGASVYYYPTIAAYATKDLPKTALGKYAIEVGTDLAKSEWGQWAIEVATEQVMPACAEFLEYSKENPMALAKWISGGIMGLYAVKAFVGWLKSDGISDNIYAMATNFPTVFDGLKTTEAKVALIDKYLINDMDYMTSMQSVDDYHAGPRTKVHGLIQEKYRDIEGCELQRWIKINANDSLESIPRAAFWPGITSNIHNQILNDDEKESYSRGDILAVLAGLESYEGKSLNVLKKLVDENIQTVTFW